MGDEFAMKPIYLAGFCFFTFISVCLVFPVFYLVGMGVQSINSDTFGLISWRLFAFTYLQALASAILAGVLGVFLAIACCETDFFGKKIIIRLSEVTFFLPTLLVVLALVGVWGSRGWLGEKLTGLNFYGWFGILLAHMFFNFSVFFKVVGQSLREMDRTEEKIALSLGASKWITFLRVGLVKLRSAIFQSFLLVFLYCSASFFVILILGGGPRFSTLETEIYQATKVDLNIPLAVCLALIQICVCLLVQGFYQSKATALLSSQSRYYDTIYGFRSSLTKRILPFGIWSVFAMLVLIPLINLMVSGFTGLSKLNLSDLIDPLFLSFIIGIQVSLIANFIAFCAAYINQHTRLPWVRQGISFLCTLPVALSTMVFGLSLILAFAPVLEWVQEKWLGVIIVQALSVLPLSFRIFSESFSKVEKEVYRSAESLGTSKAQQLFFLELPLIRNSVVLAIATSFGFSIGEAGAVLLFESQGKPTLSLLLFKLMGKYQFEEAQAVGLILLLLMIFIFIMKEKWKA